MQNRTTMTPPDVLKAYNYTSLHGPDGFPSCFLDEGKVDKHEKYFLVKTPKGDWFVFYPSDRVLREVENGDRPVDNRFFNDLVAKNIYVDVSDRVLTLEDSFDFYCLPVGCFGTPEHPYVAARNKFTKKVCFYEFKTDKWVLAYSDWQSSIDKGEWVPCNQNGILKKPAEVKTESIKDKDIFLNSETGQVSVKIGPHRVKVGIVHVLEENVNGNLSQIELLLTNRKNQLDIVRKMVESAIISQKL